MYTSTILFLILSVLLSLLLSSVLYILFLRKKNYDFMHRYSVLYQENNTLNRVREEEKIYSTQVIQELKTKLEVMQSYDEKNKKYHDSFKDVAQQTVINLGTQLTKQLLESYTHQGKNIQHNAETQIKSITSAVINQLESLSKSTNNISKEMEKSSNIVSDLKKSLLSSASVGSFTEITLQNVLTSAGLQKNTDFFLQPTLKYEEKIFRPDAILCLPRNNFIIIDAKSSKFFLESSTHEQKYGTEQDSTNTNYSAHDNNFIRSVQVHVKNLSSKNYPAALIESFSDRGPIELKNITMIMFVHSESVIEKINNIDNNFLSKAWNMDIFPVGPTGLMNIVSIAKRHIGHQKQEKNFEKILIEIRSMLSSLGVLVEHGNRLGSSIQSLTTNYDKFAASFNQNFISKSNKMFALGVMHDKTKVHNDLLDRYSLSISKTNVIGLDNKITQHDVKQKEVY